MKEAKNHPRSPKQSVKSKRSVAVIGGGLAGLTAAVELAHAGVKVTLYEKNETLGGKMNSLSMGGFTWDTGPSLLTMPHVLQELFAGLGRDMGAYLKLLPLQPACRYRWQDGYGLDEDSSFWARPDVRRFLKYAKGLYDVSAGLFLNPFADLKDWFSPSNLIKLRHLPKIASPRSMHSVVRRYFKDPHLVQFFDRFATYNGSSPYATPAAFNIIPYVQAKFGGWYVQGGMYKIAEALTAIAKEYGVDVRTSSEVTGLQETTSGYQVALDGVWESYNGVVCNQDVLMAHQNLLPRDNASRFRKTHLDRLELSSSGFILFLGVGKKYEQLAHHNVFFSNDYETEFRDIFETRRPASNPTIYVAASSRTEAQRAPVGCDNWFVLVNTPATRRSISWSSEAEAYGDKIIEQLERFGFADLRRHIRVRQTFTPSDFRRRYNSYGGSLYGFASHGLLTAFKRPSMQPWNMHNFSFAGGSTHPGGGIPLVIMSGRRAAAKLLSSLNG